MSDFTGAFPSTKTEALALTYVQNLNVSDLTPEELLEAYEDAYARIREHHKQLRKERHNSTIYV